MRGLVTNLAVTDLKNALEPWTAQLERGTMDEDADTGEWRNDIDLMGAHAEKPD